MFYADMAIVAQITKIVAEFGTSLRPVMDTNALVREQIGKLVDLGVTQKVLAKKMGVSAAWLSRWLAYNEMHSLQD